MTGQGLEFLRDRAIVPLNGFWGFQVRSYSVFLGACLLAAVPALAQTARVPPAAPAAVQAPGVAPAPAPAQPLREPSIAPSPDWIEPLPVPAANPALRDR